MTYVIFTLLAFCRLGDAETDHVSEKLTRTQLSRNQQMLFGPEAGAGR